MKRSSLLIGILSLVSLWMGCDTGTTTTSGAGSATDSAARPQPGDNQGQGGRPWSADLNILDPNGFDDLPDPLDETILPFSPSFIQSQKITRFDVTGYADVDNPFFTEETPENELRVSRRRAFTFGPDGHLTDVRDEKFLGDVTPATSIHVAWQYARPGQPSRLDIEEMVGSSKTVHQRIYRYGEDGRLMSITDPSSFSSYFSYDDSKKQTYILRRDRLLAADVIVIGNRGDFPDPTVLDLAGDILARESNFIPYSKAGDKISSIKFLEREGRKTLREVLLGKRNGEIDYYIDRKYNADDNLQERKFQWDVPNANFKTLTKYRYTPQGDLEEVFHQKQPFNGAVVNEIARYSYDPKGLLQKCLHTTRTDQAKSELVLVEYFKATLASETPHADTPQPGGTR